MVYMIWNQPPFAIVTRTPAASTPSRISKAIRSWRAGHADHAAAAGVRAEEQLEGEKIKISNMAPNLQSRC